MRQENSDRSRVPQETVMLLTTQRIVQNNHLTTLGFGESVIGVELEANEALLIPNDGVLVLFILCLSYCSFSPNGNRGDLALP